MESNAGFRQGLNRVKIGKQIFKYFVEELKEQIRSAMRSYFHPIFDICKHPLKTISKQYPNYQFHREQHYIVIRADWIEIVEPFTSRYKEITINGSWDFKYLNAGYVNEKVDFLDLQIKNVTGSVTQIDDDSNATVKLMYSMEHYWIKINQTQKDVRVTIPKSATFSVTPNDNSSSVNISKIKEKFESSVAYFLKRSLYGEFST